jgi:hypothetical protein
MLDSGAERSDGFVRGGLVRLGRPGATGGPSSAGEEAGWGIWPGGAAPSGVGRVSFFYLWVSVGREETIRGWFYTPNRILTSLSWVATTGVAAYFA